MKTIRTSQTVSNVVTAGETFASIIPVDTAIINKVETSIVSARALHSALGVDTRFSDWIKRRIAEYKFGKDVDYVIVEILSDSKLSSAKSRQQVTHDYLITLSMAKELAMVASTEQGRAIRQYFIKCEEELRKVAPLKAADHRRDLKINLHVADHYKTMCDALIRLRAAAGKETKDFHYANESTMIDRMVLAGLTAKKWAEVNGYSGSPRSHMNRFQLMHMSYLELTNTAFIEAGQSYHDRKATLIALSQSWLARKAAVIIAGEDY
ncbi:MAG: antA/AntB antirepressor family protein [Scandinavium sp.]|uniref:antA/AntB antirepressor family protein n=1 Tax=Scandinavium sp. TaxID=2830653 RepID=UPI003F3F7774